MPIDCKCKTCGKEFKLKPSAVKRGRGVFCSKKCLAEDRRITFTGKNNPNWKDARKEVFCQQCGKKFWMYKNYINQGYGKFCSYSCKFKYENTGDRNYNWNGGKFARSDGYIMCSWFDGKKAAKRYEHICIAEKVMGRPLKKDEVVHHINGNKGDNRNINLLVCHKNYHHWLHQNMAKKYQQEHFGGL